MKEKSFWRLTLWNWEEEKQEVKILNEPAAMYRFNDVVVVTLSGLIGDL